MDWSNEDYVRLYTRETSDDLMLSWEAIALWRAMLCRFDRAGLIDTKRGHRGLAALVRMPADVVERVLPELLEDGRVQAKSFGYFAPNFMEAQSATKSDRQRQKEARERRNATARAMPNVTECDSAVTNRDETSRAVTNGHEPSQPVTLTSADPCLASAEDLSLPGARAIPPSPEPVAQPAPASVPAASPPPPPREDIAMPDASSAPGVSHRTAIRTTLRAELEAARTRAAASHRTTVTPLLAFEHGIDVDLQGHLSGATTMAALADLEVQGRKAIAMAELEVTLGLQSFQWFNGAVFSGRNFSRLASRNPEDVRREAAEKRAKAERAALAARANGSHAAPAPPRKPDPKPVVQQSTLTPEERLALAAESRAQLYGQPARAGPVPASPTDDPDDEPITESSA